MKSFFQRKYDNTAQAKSASKLWNPRQPEPEIPHKSSGRTEKQILGTGVKKSSDKQRSSSRAPRPEPPTEVHGTGTNYITAYTAPPSKSSSSRPPLTTPSSSIPNTAQRPPQHVDNTRTAKTNFDMPTGSYNMPQASIRLVTDQNVVPPSPYVGAGRQASSQPPAPAPAPALAPAPTPGPTFWIPPSNAYSSSSRMYREGGADDNRERERLNGMERREREKDRGRDRDRIRDRDREIEKAEGRGRERERDARARERLREDPQARVRGKDVMERDRTKDRDPDRGRERDKERMYRDRELERREKADRERAKMRETLQRDRERPSTRDKENSRVREAPPLDSRDYYPYREVDRKQDAERPRGQSRHPEREKNRVPELPPSSDRVKVDEWGRTMMRDNKAHLSTRAAGKDSSDEGENSDAQKYGVSRRRDRTYDMQNQSASGAYVPNGAAVLATPSVSQNAPQSSSRSRVTPQSASYAPPQQYVSKAPSIAIPAPQSTSTKPFTSTSQVAGQATSLSQHASNSSKPPAATSSTSQTANYNASNGQHARVPSSNAQYPHSSAHNMAQAQAGARMTGATVPPTQAPHITSPPSNPYSSNSRPPFTSTSTSAQIPIAQSNSKASNNSVSYASQMLPQTYSASTQHLSKTTSASAPVPPTPIHIPSVNLSSNPVPAAPYEPQNRVAQPPVAIPVKQLAELREPQSGNEGIGTSSGSDNELKGNGHRSRRKHREREDYDRTKYSSRPGNEYRPPRTATTQPVVTSSSTNPALSSRDRARAADLPVTHTSLATTTDNVRADRRQASTSARYGTTTAENPVPVAPVVPSSTYVAPSAVRDYDGRRDLEPVTSALGDNTKADRRQATTSAIYGTSDAANAVAMPPATSLSTYPVPSTTREYDERRGLEQVGGYPAISSSKRDYIAPIRPIDDSPPYASVSQHSPLRRTDGIDSSAATWRPPSRPQSRAYGTHTQAPVTVGNSPHPSLQTKWTPPTAAKTSPALHSSDHSKGSPQGQLVNSSPGRGTVAAADSPVSGAVRRAGDHSPSTQAGQPFPSNTAPVAQAASNVPASTSKSHDYQATRDRSGTRVSELVAGYEMRTSPAAASRSALSRSEKVMTESRPSGGVNGTLERPPENNSPSFNVSLAANDRGRVISISASNDSGSPNVAVEPAMWNSSHSPNRTHVASEARARKQSDSRPGKSDPRGSELPPTDPGPRRIHNAESYSKPSDYNGTGTALASATLFTALNGKNAEAEYRPATQHYQASASNQQTHIYPGATPGPAAASSSMSSARARRDEPTINSSAYRKADAPVLSTRQGDFVAPTAAAATQWNRTGEVPSGSKIADATRNQSSSQPVEPSGNVMSFRHPALAELLSDNVLRSPIVTTQQQTTVPVTQSHSNQTQPLSGATSWPDPSPTPVPVSSRTEPAQSTTTRNRPTSTNMPFIHNTPAIYQSNGYNEQVPVLMNADTSRPWENISAKYPNGTYPDAGRTAPQPAAIPPSPQTSAVVNSTHLQNHMNHSPASIIPAPYPNPSPTSVNNAAILHNADHTFSQQRTGNRGYEVPATEKPYDVLPSTTNAVSSSVSQNHPLGTDTPSHIPPTSPATRRPVYPSLHDTAPAHTNASPSVPSPYISQHQNPNQYGTSSHISSGARPPSPERRPRRRPSEESLLKTPSSLATSLKPTVSRTSVPASVHSSQEPRKKGFLSRLMSKQPQDTHQIWHPQEEPTLQVPIKHEVTSKVKTELTSHKSPNKKVFTPFRYLSSKRNRTMSAASVEAVDGTAPNTVGSPTASMHSSQPPFQPPSMRDPYLATQEWQGDFNSLRGERKYRTYKPGVVFDVAHEPAHDRQNLKYSQSRSRRKSSK